MLSTCSACLEPWPFFWCTALLTVVRNPGTSVGDVNYVSVRLTSALMYLQPE